MNRNRTQLAFSRHFFYCCIAISLEQQSASVTVRRVSSHADAHSLQLPATSLRPYVRSVDQHLTDHGNRNQNCSVPQNVMAFFLVSLLDPPRPECSTCAGGWCRDPKYSCHSLYSVLRIHAPFPPNRWGCVEKPLITQQQLLASLPLPSRLYKHALQNTYHVAVAPVRFA